MARLSKRKRRKTDGGNLPQKPPFTKKNEIFLLVFIALNIIVLALGFRTMGTPELLMYALLILALVGIYVRRKFDIPDKFEKYLDNGSLGAIGIAFVLFTYICYQKFSA